jgi:hypothetical protein
MGGATDAFVKVYRFTAFYLAGMVKTSSFLQEIPVRIATGISATLAEALYFFPLFSKANTGRVCQLHNEESFQISHHHRLTDPLHRSGHSELCTHTGAKTNSTRL